MIKRGLSATIEEWLMSAEYIMSGGNRDVILCERGIRTFERATRNTLDLCAIPVVKKLSHLPIIIDPSHASGLPYMIKPMSLASVVAGCDGLIIEVHDRIDEALCDKNQAITIDELEGILNDIKKINLEIKKENIFKKENNN
jgi:3-deoxy-7-phosphoheptulonate synthase